MFKPFFMALCYNMNHHPEKKYKYIKNIKNIRKKEVRLTIRNTLMIGITFIHSKALTPHLHTCLID